MNPDPKHFDEVLKKVMRIHNKVIDALYSVEKELQLEDRQLAELRKDRNDEHVQGVYDVVLHMPSRSRYNN